MPLTSYDLAGPDPNPMSVAEVDALKGLIKTSFDPSLPLRVVQIGAERGCSTLAILEAHRDAFIVSIDIGPRPEEFRNVEAAGLDTSRVIRVLGRSQYVGRHWPYDWEPDLIFIDGDHRYEGVFEDITVWAPLVRVGGLVVLHDYIDPSVRAPHIVGRVYEAVRDHVKDGALGYGIGYKAHMVVERLIAFKLSNFAYKGGDDYDDA